jgi:hypothetical protein
MARYSVSGTLSPDATTADTGEAPGVFIGQNYWTWTNDAGTWYLFAGTYAGETPTWNVSNLLGLGLGIPIWQGPNSSNPVGDYTPLANATGTATVAEITEPAADEYYVIQWKASGEFTILKKR